MLAYKVNYLYLPIIFGAQTRLSHHLSGKMYAVKTTVGIVISMVSAHSSINLSIVSCL